MSESKENIRNHGGAPTASPNDVHAAVSAGMQIGDPKVIGEMKLGVVLPPGHALHTFDLEQELPRPTRKRGHRSFATADSFIRYVKAHAVAGTAIYAAKDETTFNAIINGHQHEADTDNMRSAMATIGDHDAGNASNSGGAGSPMRAEGPFGEDEAERRSSDDAAAVGGVLKGLAEAMSGIVSLVEGGAGLPGWGDFTAEYNCPLSREWKRWIRHSQHEAESDAKRGMKQAEFMQFLEDNLPDITKPDASVLLAAVRTFEAKKDVQFKSHQRAENGDIIFNYSETTHGASSDGRVALPEMFELTIPVFDGGSFYVVEARLRFRIQQGGGLLLWYELVRPHKVLEHAFNVVRAQIDSALNNVPVYDV